MHSGLIRFIASNVCSRYIEGVRCRLLANTSEVDIPPGGTGSVGRSVRTRSSSSPILVDLYGASPLSVTIEADVAIGVVGVVSWTVDGGSTRLHGIDGDAHWTRSSGSTCYVCSLRGVGVSAIRNPAKSYAPSSSGGVSLGSALRSCPFKELHGATAFGAARDAKGAVFIVSVVLGAGDLGRSRGYADGRDFHVVKAQNVRFPAIPVR